MSRRKRKWVLLRTSELERRLGATYADGWADRSRGQPYMAGSWLGAVSRAIADHTIADAHHPDTARPPAPGGPDDGHRFHITVESAGSYGTIGSDDHHDVEYDDVPPFELTVRAWSLQDAVAQAAKVRLPDWWQDGRRARDAIE